MKILEDYSFKITCITMILVVKLPLYANIRSGCFDCNIIALQWMTSKGEVNPDIEVVLIEAVKEKKKIRENLSKNRIKIRKL